MSCMGLRSCSSTSARTSEKYLPGIRRFASRACMFFALWAVMTTASWAQFSSLVSFNEAGGGGGTPESSFIQGVDGALYGTTVHGGVGYGTVFKVTTSGMVTILHEFTSGSDGAYPTCALAIGSDGNLYGTTSFGGDNVWGTVFKMTPGGTLTTLHSFGGADGAGPTAGLFLASNGVFYGTTEGGGANGDGTVFKITQAGGFTLLHSFKGTDGKFPYAGVIQATNGYFYGTTSAGGTGTGVGTIFKMTTGGLLSTLHNFNLSDGDNPYAALTQGADGNLYGTTANAGTNGDGTVFKITTGGVLNVLHNFDGTDGQQPMAALVQGSNGNFYGTAQAGGTSLDGTLFVMTPAGALTTLHSFDGTDGAHPYYGPLMIDTNGLFYGTTAYGGTNGEGTIFSLGVGLGPFVELMPTSGKVGAAIKILGQNFVGTTVVSFNGTHASFTVKSATEITATVPNGATTGLVSVTTPSGVLHSNVKFRVTPQIKSFTPTSGPVGTTVVTITGVSLTGTTKVTFGGVAATSFTVESDTQVTATVPAGAKTGKISVTTPGGTANSATNFTVT